MIGLKFSYLKKVCYSFLKTGADFCFLQNTYLKYSNKRDLKKEPWKPKPNKTLEMDRKTSREATLIADKLE